MRRHPKRDQIATAFGERLRLVMAHRGFTQQKLADVSSLSPAGVSHFVCGRRLPSFSNLRQLGLTLNVSLDWLTEPTQWNSASGPIPTFGGKK